MAPVLSGRQEGLRILHVIDGIQLGGADLVLVRLVERLQAAGHQNAIVSLMTPERLSERFVAAGAAVEGLGFAPGRLPGPASLQRLRASFRRHRPDIVRGLMYHGNLAASVGRWISGCTAPVVWSIHSTLYPPPEPKLRAHTRLAIRLGAALSGTTAAVVYVSATSVPQHERIGYRRDRRTIIRNGIDCERFRPNPAVAPRLRAQLGIPHDTRLVGLFARWDPMKGHADLLAAARRLLAEGHRLHLVFAGKRIEPGNEALTGAIDAAGLRPHVSLFGERDDVEDLLAGIDVFALPSVWGEAFSNALGEAMAMGVPCIATDVGDSAWMLENAGQVVPPGDSAALVSGLRRLLEMSVEERQQIGAAARRRVLEHFSLPQMVQQYEDLYLSLSARRHVDPSLQAIEVEGRP